MTKAQVVMVCISVAVVWLAVLVTYINLQFVIDLLQCIGIFAAAMAIRSHLRESHIDQG